MAGALILLTLVGGLAALGLMALVGYEVWSYVMSRVRKKDSWEDEQAEYAKKKAREDWEKILQREREKGSGSV